MRRLASIAATAWVIATMLSPVTPVSAATTVASDSFNRAVLAGWGNADAGGTWSILDNASNWSVVPGAGSINVGAAGQERGVLGSVNVRDVDVLVKTALPRSTQGNNCLLYLLGRYASGGGPSYYRVGAGQGMGSTVIIRTQRSDGTSVNPDVDTGIAAADGLVLNLRVEFQGINPTTIRARAWVDGTGEPTVWSVVASDGNAPEQVSGSIGLRARNDDTSAAHLYKVTSYQAIALPPPAPASDSFDRTVTAGWGTADSGGPWSIVDTASSWSVSPGAGSVVVGPSGQERAYLGSVAVQDVEVVEKVVLPRCVNAGANCNAYILGRYTAGGTPGYYRVGVIQGGTPTIQIRAQRSDGAALTTDLDTAIPAADGAIVWLRVQFQGINPTAIRARAWLDRAAEPSLWTLDVTDSNAAQQVAGAIGVRGRNDDTTARTFKWLQFSAATLSARPALPAGLATDAFNRTIANGWGTADVGGGWNSTGSNYAVVPGRATILANPATVANYLTSVSARDVDMLAWISPSPMTSAYADSGVAVRYVAPTGTFYQVSAYYATSNNNGNYTVQLKRKPENVEINPDVNTAIPGGSALWIRMEAQGANPTTLRWKVWQDGTPEPAAWMGTGTDSTLADQGAGGVGVEAYVDSGSTTIAFNGLTATALP